MLEFYAIRNVMQLLQLTYIDDISMNIDSLLNAILANVRVI